MSDALMKYLLSPQAAAHIEKLEAELRLMKTAGVIEVAIRNLNVYEYMAHWERRAEGAEAKLAKAVGALEFYADPTYSGYDVCIEDYGLSLTTGCIIQDDGDLARTTLAALKGQDDA